MASGLSLMDSTHMEPSAEDRAAALRTQARGGGGRRRSRRLLWLPILFPLGITAVLFSIQTRLIFPGSESQGQASAKVRASPGEELVTLKTARGDQIVALFGSALTPEGSPDPDAPSRPTLLYFYGNGMCLRDAADEFTRFRRLGLNVMIPEYPGYGMSDGKPSEAGCYAAADAAYDYLRTRKDVNPSLIVAGGWSLGGAVALDLASRRSVAGLIAFSTFTSMVDMARRNFPFVPASILLRHRFDNRRKVAKVGCPILIGHGRRDQLVPFEMSERLTAAAKAPVMQLAVDDAGHNDFYAVGGEKVFAAIRQFLGVIAPTVDRN